MKLLRHHNHSFLQPCTKFVHVETNAATLGPLAIDANANFHEAKETSERLIKEKVEDMLVQYDMYSDKDDPALQKRAKEILERVRLTVKGREDKDQKAADMDWKAYKDIFTKYDATDETKTDNREALHTDRNEIFTDFTTKAERTKLDIDITTLTGVREDATKIELLKWMKDNKYTFEKGRDSEGGNEIILNLKGKPFQVIPNGITGLYPVFGKKQKIIGMMTIDADGDTAVRYAGGVSEHTDTINQADWSVGINQEVQNEYKETSGKIGSIVGWTRSKLGIEDNLTRHVFDHTGEKTSKKGTRHLLDSDKQTKLADNATLEGLGDKTANPTTAKPALEKVIDKNSHVHALEDAMGKGDTMQTLDENDNALTIEEGRSKTSVWAKFKRWWKK